MVLQAGIQPWSDRVSTGLSWSWGLALACGCLIQRSGSWQDPGTAVRVGGWNGFSFQPVEERDPQSCSWDAPGAPWRGAQGEAWFWSLCSQGNPWNLCGCAFLHRESWRAGMHIQGVWKGPGTGIHIQGRDIMVQGYTCGGMERALVLGCILRDALGSLPASVHRCLGFSMENHVPPKLLGGGGLVLPSALAREAAGRPR